MCSDSEKSEGAARKIKNKVLLHPAMGARNLGIGLSYRPASLCSLATQFQTRSLESIPRPIAGLLSFRLRTEWNPGSILCGSQALTV